MSKPDLALVQRAIANMHTAEDVDYFFDQLKSPDWIEPLAAAGLFSAPPGPSRSDLGVSFPFWSASRYLARMAEKDPKRVRQVVRQIPDSDNVRVMHDLLDAILMMPPEMAVEFLPRIIGWLEQPFKLLVPSKLGQLLRKLSAAKLVQPALTLASALFAVHEKDSPSMIEGWDFPAEPEPLFDSYEYEELISSCREDFINGTGMAGLRALGEILASVVTIESGGRDTDYRDHSSTWRSAIEPHAQNALPDVKNAIVLAVREAAIQLMTTKGIKEIEVVDALEAMQWTVFFRIALDVLRVVGRRRSAAVSVRLLSRRRMYSNELHHEYWTLLQDRFTDLTSKQRDSVIAGFKIGPRVYTDPNGPFGVHGSYEGEGQVALECWQVRLLSAISSELSADDREWFDQLVAKGRLSDHPDFLSYSSGMWTGPTSPVTEADVAQMSVDDLVEYLSGWQPNSGFAMPSPEGLARVLAGAVKGDPERFAEYAPRMRQLDPTYVNGYLSGYRELVMNRNAVQWKPILELCQWVVDQEREIPGRTSEYGDLDTGWGWTRSTIAHLLSAGFSDGSSEIPFELQSLAWEVLLPLTEDPDPSGASEAKYGGSNMDPVTLAINTVRGQAIEAVNNYALWIHRHLDDAGRAEGFDWMPEVRTVLDRHLDREVESSYAVHSIYGRKFPWLQLLDETWASHNVSRIFPSGEADGPYWDAAWDAYITYCPAYDTVFDVLREEYGRAITMLGREPTDRKRPAFAQDHLPQHLVTFYLRGKIALDDPLLTQFFATASPELRSRAMSFIGRSFSILVDGEFRPLPTPPSDDVLARARLLWEFRLGEARRAEDPLPYKEELAEYGWWSISPHFESDWVLDQLTAVLRTIGTVDAGHQVVKRLAELADSRPKAVLKVLELMLQGDKDGWLVLSWKDSVTDVLRSTLSSPEADVRSLATDVTQQLGARGYREFRSLLKHPPTAETEDGDPAAG